jgi:hypothetical protein
MLSVGNAPLRLARGRFQAPVVASASSYEIV